MIKILSRVMVMNCLEGSRIARCFKVLKSLWREGIELSGRLAHWKGLPTPSSMLLKDNIQIQKFNKVWLIKQNDTEKYCLTRVVLIKNFQFTWNCTKCNLVGGCKNMISTCRVRNYKSASFTRTNAIHPRNISESLFLFSTTSLVMWSGVDYFVKHCQYILE